MNDLFYFFAYGSSMNPVTLVTRVRSCVAVGMGRLVGHSLVFNKRPGDSGGEYGEANAIATGDVRDEIVGVVYRIATQDSRALDRCEGVAEGFCRVTGLVDLDGADV
ncbi:MAG: gamma-glutamylcyclotransferase family protein, partial [Gammaproteobacteria bacterium]